MSKLNTDYFSKKCLKPYFPSSKKVDELTFKDIFRYAAKHGLITLEEAERWLAYRDNRNETTHDYGKEFANETNETMALLPQFIKDSYKLNEIIQNPAE